MKLIGVPTDLPRTWGGFTIEEFMQTLAKYEPDLPYAEVAEQWRIWCQMMPKF